MLFGLVASIFAIINTVMTPIEAITGLHGLFLWNGMGGEFRLLIVAASFVASVSLSLSRMLTLPVIIIYASYI